MQHPVDCPICLTILHGTCQECDNGHLFHIKCLEKHFRQGRAECPICRNCPTSWLYAMEQLCTRYIVHVGSVGGPPLLCQTLSEARRTCMEINGDLSCIWEYKRRRGNDMIRQLYQKTYQKRPKILESYLRDANTVYIANGTAYSTLEEAEAACTDLGEIVERVNGDMGQPVYFAVYQNA